MTLNDLRPEFVAAYEQAATLSAAVRPDQLSGSTPCTKMDVSQLLDHLVFASRRAAGLGRGEAPAFETSAPHVELEDAPVALRAAGADAEAAWKDDGSLDRIAKMPWGMEYPGRALLAIYLIEIATHVWDLAVATGNEELLDESLGPSALACAEATIKPEYRNDNGDPFGPVVTAPDGATTWERLGAFMGRAPR